MSTIITCTVLHCRVAWQRIPHCIIKLDQSAFQTADDVRAVLHCLPTQDEANMLQSYIRAGGSLEGLSPAELFCLALMKVYFSVCYSFQHVVKHNLSFSRNIW